MFDKTLLEWTGRIQCCKSGQHHQIFLVVTSLLAIQYAYKLEHGGDSIHQTVHQVNWKIVSASPDFCFSCDCCLLLTPQLLHGFSVICVFAMSVRM